ncbi:MAG: B12-binding domain-containing radical SAM protein [Planctomycetota bacterium]
MRITLVATNRCQVPQIVMPVGACQMAESLSDAGHNVELIDLMFESDPVAVLSERLRGDSPDLVGLSIRNIDNGDLRNPVSFCDELSEICECVRRQVDAPLVIGGGAVSVVPEELLRLTGADRAIVGEGEGPMHNLLDCMGGRSAEPVPGVATLEGGTLAAAAPDRSWAMDRPVAPDYSRWLDVGRYRAYGAATPVQTKRGCPRRCIYCTYPLLEGREHRTSEPALVADAVRRLWESGAREVEFVDNVFNDPPGHALAICEELIRRDIPVRLGTAELSPRGLNKSLLEAMNDAGFNGFGLTVESASEKVLSGLRKGYGPDRLQAVARAVHHQDLPCMWMYMLGGPGETRETVERTLDFAESRLRRQDAALFFPGIRIFPGTRIADIARQEGMLPDGDVNFLYPHFYMSPALEKDWLIAEVRARARRVSGFVPPSSRSAAYLPWVYRLAGTLGLERPFWRHTSSLRRWVAPLGL